jgi:D-alanyl-D-alanine carboxypeptidase (penicillin-binding protein 5/6)
MFRSFITLLLLANLTGGIYTSGLNERPIVFDNSDLLEANQIPIKTVEAVKPDIEAKSALVMDLQSGIFLYEKNPYTRMPVASLTKIMTAVIIIESHDLDEVVTIDENYGALPEEKTGVKIWLQKGEEITVRNLLTALLVRSAGDAALALAKYHSGSVEAFVEEMNKRASEMNLMDTHFTNPVGVDEDNHYSSSYDLSILTKRALRFKIFRNIVQLKEAEVTSTDGRIKHAFKSTNLLLNSYLDIRGVKTGTTDSAGESVINLARSENGHEIIAVLLNSPDRFQENKSIIDWVFRNYRW